jgi:hypothetical protein
MDVTTRPIEKLDLRRRFKDLYTASASRVSIVDVPELQFLALEGRTEAGIGPGESATFTEAVGAMYAVAYALKFASKLRPELPVDFTVMPLEGLWSTESGEFENGKVEPWLFTLLILQPDHITAEMMRSAVADAGKKRQTPALRRLRLLRWREGLSIQVMHRGPYADEPRTMELLETFAEEQGFRLTGRHHEIYLGDPRRAKPENLKTILRHPVAIA